MGERPKRPLRRYLTALMLLAACALAVAACGGSSKASGGVTLASSTVSGALAPATAPGVSEAACGKSAASVATATVKQAAERIYGLELDSREVRADQLQVQGYAPLLSALAAGDQAAVHAAVTSLVYSHTHIVRLRVTRGRTVLADVGGPYIIAPVSGYLRVHGHAVARYVLSVQDDLGYVKLETRYVGFPLLLRRGAERIPVEGVIPSGSPAIPDSGVVDYRGGRYHAVSFTARAFPAGPLKVTVLVPTPPAGLGCHAVVVYETGHIAKTMWDRFVLVGAPPRVYVRGAAELTGALTFIRSGSHQIAGSAKPGPARLPSSGTVTYRGVEYRVISFPARSAGRGVRVYELVAP